MAFQLADLLEHLCDANPDAPMLVAGDTAFSRGEIEARANRLAHAFAARGLGPGDPIGIYAHNRVEWVEALIACWKIRATAININFRYVTDELRYLFDNAELKGLVYERRFENEVRALAPDHPTLRALWALRSADEDAQGSSLGADYAQALAAESPARDFAPRSGDDHYVVYTGGTTGMPKGVVWRHADLYSNIARPFAGRLEHPHEIKKQSDNPLGMRTLTLSPLMHGGGQWPMFISIMNGGVGLFPISPHFDPAEILGMLEQHQVTTLSIIGDAMGRPLAELKRDAPERFDTSSLIAISSGGALLTDPVRQLIREAFGKIYLTGGIGSSEIGAACKETRVVDPISGPRFSLDPNVAVLDDDLKPIEPGHAGVGRLARRGYIPLGYYKDPEKTAETFLTDKRGERWVVPGDWARVEDDGTISLLGRGSACINSGGEKVFPDEVEGVIARHPAVRHASVVGVPDADWMERIVALVELEADTQLELDALQAHCRAHLAGYKIPRGLVIGPLERTPTGKVDQVWARARARTEA
jgi:acyl-CoA synthetase (AMP-forming)/AMP-acid ligase II